MAGNIAKTLREVFMAKPSKNKQRMIESLPGRLGPATRAQSKIIKRKVNATRSK